MFGRSNSYIGSKNSKAPRGTPFLLFGIVIIKLELFEMSYGPKKRMMTLNLPKKSSRSVVNSSKSGLVRLEQHLGPWVNCIYRVSIILLRTEGVLEKLDTRQTHSNGWVLHIHSGDTCALIDNHWTKTAHGDYGFIIYWKHSVRDHHLLCHYCTNPIYRTINYR